MHYTRLMATDPSILNYEATGLVYRVVVDAETEEVASEIAMDFLGVERYAWADQKTGGEWEIVFERADLH